MKKLLKTSNNKRRKRRRCTKNWMDYSVGTSNTSTSDEAGNFVAEGFGFEPGPEFALDTFEKYANDFKVQYFRKNSSVNDPGNMPTVQE